MKSKNVFNLIKRTVVCVAAMVSVVASFDIALYKPSEWTDSTLLQVKNHYKDRLDGLGVEWDPMLLTPYNTANENIPEEYRTTEEDFEMCCERAKEMGIDKIRCFYTEEWIEPVNDNEDPYDINWDAFVWNEPHIITLMKQLDYCQREGVKVNLTVWGTYPGNHEEYAENMYVIFTRLREMGYSCVTEMTPFNEPCWGYKINDKVDMEDYWQLCRVIDGYFTKKGSRKKVILNLSDCNYSDDSVATMEELGRMTNVYNTHSYDYVSAIPDNSMVDMSKILTRYAHKYGAKHLVSEFGPDTCINSMISSDTDTYTRGLLISRITVNYLNGGTSGMLYWCLCDQYYSYGGKMSVGLWQYKDFGWKARPQYYAFSLLTKYTDAGAKIYPIILEEENHLCAIAIKNPDRTWTYVVINSSDESRDICFANQHFRFGNMDRYVYSEDRLPDNDRPIESDSKFTIKNGLLEDSIPGQTMYVYTNK